jgi:hypothetical protein
MTGTWRRSSYSTAEGQCTEVAALPGGGVGVRDSKNPQGGALRLSAAAWRTFLDAIKAGRFDTLA